LYLTPKLYEKMLNLCSPAPGKAFAISSGLTASVAVGRSPSSKHTNPAQA
jgi:hypothetical protein